MKRIVISFIAIVVCAVSSISHAEHFGMMGGTISTCETNSGSGTSTYVVCINDPLTGGNELGTGGTGLKSGVSNVYIQYGNVAGYVSPGRLLDGVNDYFVPAEGFWDVMLNNTGTWTIMIEMSGVVETALNDDLLYVRDTLFNNALQLYSAGGSLKAYAESGSSVVYNNETVGAAYPIAGTVWFVAASNAALNKSVIGYVAGDAQPTLASQLVNQLHRTAVTWPAGLHFADYRGLFANSVDGGNTIGGIAIKVIVSKDCLIDFRS